MIKLEEFFSDESKLNLLNSNELKKIKNPDNIKYLIEKYLMEDGDVFIFDGKSQMRSTHAVLDMKGCGERINLTFRSGV